MESFSYDKKLAPRERSKPFITFIGEGFETVEELKHLKEVLLDLFRGEVSPCFTYLTVIPFSNVLILKK